MVSGSHSPKAAVSRKLSGISKLSLCRYGAETRSSRSSGNSAAFARKKTRLTLAGGHIAQTSQLRAQFRRPAYGSTWQLARYWAACRCVAQRVRRVRRLIGIELGPSETPGARLWAHRASFAAPRAVLCACVWFNVATSEVLGCLPLRCAIRPRLVGFSSGEARH